MAVTAREDNAAAGTPQLALKLDRLSSILRDCGSVIIAYSGGADSAFLAAVSHEALGANSLAVTAKSPSLAPDELTSAVELATARGWSHRVMETREVEDPRYVANNTGRCFFCKDELYTRLSELANAEGFRVIANGTNVDDLGDFRPGLDAARKYGVRSPLVEAGLSKEEVRQLSRRLVLPTWDKPAQACLSSRIPYGTEVSIKALGQIAAAESVLRSLGFRQVRVRHHDQVARIEVPAHDIPRLVDPEISRTVHERLRHAGYLYVTVDLAGFRSGSLNEGIKRRRNGSGSRQRG